MSDFLTELARVRAETEQNLAVLEDLYRASLSSKSIPDDTARHWDVYHLDNRNTHVDTHGYGIDEPPADLGLSWEEAKGHHQYDRQRYHTDADFPAPPNDDDSSNHSASSIDDMWQGFDVDHYSPPPVRPRDTSPVRDEPQPQLKYTIPKPFNLSQSRGKTRSEKMIEVCDN